MIREELTIEDINNLLELFHNKIDEVYGLPNLGQSERDTLEKLNRLKELLK